MAEYTMDKQTEINNLLNGSESVKKSVKVSNGALTEPLLLPSSPTDGKSKEVRVQFDGAPSQILQDEESDSSSSGSSSSSSSSESLELSEARPPDGGWGWVIVAASFIVNVIADGIVFSFGVMFVEFHKYFGQNRGTTAWIGGLFMAMPHLSGPIASFLTDRYGCKRVTIFGSILAAGGFIVSSLVNSMTVICITFGIISGFGLSLCYVASVVIVAYYFDRKRSFATGLAVCGSGIGTFIFAPLIQYLFQEYGWRGAMLILAGFFLNLSVCGALMRDLPWTSEKIKSKARERKRKRKSKRKRSSNGESASPTNSTNTGSVLQPISEHDEDQVADLARLSSSLVNLPTFVRTGEKVPMEVMELLSHKNVYPVLLANYPSLMMPARSLSDSGRLHEFNQTSTKLPQKPTFSSPPRAANTKKPPTAAYLKDLRLHRLSVTYRGAMLNINRYRLRASSCPDIYRDSMTTIAKEKSQWYSGLWDLWDLLADMFDFSHFADSKFLLFAISNFLLYAWYDIPYVYITDHAVQIGVSEEGASLLISIIGIINMFGEVFLGWLGDRRWVSAGVVYAICMGLCGVFTAIIPLIQNYTYLCILSGLFGFFIAANYSLTSIILVDLLTIDRFTNAYGLLLLVQGIANVVGVPLGGWLCDITSTFHLSFYLGGLFIALSGFPLIVIPIIKKYKKFTSKQSSVSEMTKEPELHNIITQVSEKQP